MASDQPVGATSSSAPSYQPPARPRSRSLRNSGVLALSPIPYSQLILTRSVIIPAGAVQLPVDLGLPPQATGLVLLVHGAGSSRLSSRSRHIRRLLQQATLGTLAVDLFTPREERQQHVSQLPAPLLAERLSCVAAWTQQQPALLGNRLGLLSEAGTVPAAFAACPHLGSYLGALVCLSCRMASATPLTRVPTLLVVGERDAPSVAACTQLQQELGLTCQLCPIEQASYLLPEPGALAHAMQHTTAWFTKYLAKPGSA